MDVVFDLLRAIVEYWFRIKNGISLGAHFGSEKESLKGLKYSSSNAHLIPLRIVYNVYGKKFIS